MRWSGYGGIVASSSTETAAYIMAFPPQNDVDLVQIRCRFWTPEELLKEFSKRDGKDYEAWAQQGALIPTPGNTTDYDAIFDEVVDSAEKFDLQQVAYNPRGTTHLANQLMDEDIPVIQMRNTATHMHEPMELLKGQINSRKLAHGDHPVLRWQFGNLAVRVNREKEVCPDPEKSGGRIDGVIALAMAVGRALINVEDEPDDPGITVI